MMTLLVDCHALVRSGMAMQLRNVRNDIEVVEASGATDMLRLAGLDSGIDVVLVDIPTLGAKWEQAIEKLRGLNSDLPIIALSGSKTMGEIRKALTMGVRGFIPKSSTFVVMLKAIELVLSGGVYIPPEVLSDDEEPNKGSSNDGLLSPRHKEVLELLAKGQSNKKIARALGITDGTVKIHVSFILRALRVHNRTHAVIAAQERGLLRGSHGSISLGVPGVPIGSGGTGTLIASAAPIGG